LNAKVENATVSAAGMRSQSRPSPFRIVP